MFPATTVEKNDTLYAKNVEIMKHCYTLCIFPNLYVQQSGIFVYILSSSGL